MEPARPGRAWRRRALFAALLPSFAVALAPAARPAARTPHASALRRCIGGALCAGGAALLAAAPAGALSAPSRFAGEYADQLHPLCERRITVEKVDRRYVAHFSGTDVGPKGIGDKVSIACDAENVERYKLREFAFDGEIAGDKIDAGDGVHVGRFNRGGGENAWTGIRWRDGNRWIVIPDAVKPLD